MGIEKNAKQSSIVIADCPATRPAPSLPLTATPQMVQIRRSLGMNQGISGRADGWKNKGWHWPLHAAFVKMGKSPFSRRSRVPEPVNFPEPGNPARLKNRREVVNASFRR